MIYYYFFLLYNLIDKDLFNMPWYLFGFVCTFFIGLHLVTSKKILVFENALEFLTVLASAQFLVLLPIIPYVEIPSMEVFLLIIFQGILLTVGLLLQFTVLRKMPISTVATLGNLMPLFLFSFAFFMLGESLNDDKLTGLVILVFGAYMVDYAPGDILGPIKKVFSSKLEQFLLISIMLLASVAMLDKMILSEGISALSLLFFSQLCLAISTLSCLLIIEKKEGVKKAYTTKGTWVLLTAMLKNLGNLAYFHAVSLTYVSLVVPIRQLASFISAFIGGTIFKEKNLFRKSIACLIMIAGVILIIL